MKIEYGNVLDIDEGVIIHGCNAMGVMGSGIALEIKNRFPTVYEAYMRTYAAQGNMFYMGQLIPVEVAPGKWIINAITQKTAGRDPDIRYVSYDAVATAFKSTRQFIEQALPTYDVLGTTPKKLYFPLIGAGLGNGNWDVIAAIIESEIPDTIEKTLYKFVP
jgi:O-acetyl-ADP-ribose deacetylase (regulator of RNase III)